MPGKEADLARFLAGGLEIVKEEQATIVWFAMRLGPSTFGISDAFADESGRDAYLAGRIAAALIENVGKLLHEPVIETVDVIATKLPR